MDLNKKELLILIRTLQFWGEHYYCDLLNLDKKSELEIKINSLFKTEDFEEVERIERDLMDKLFKSFMDEN